MVEKLDLDYTERTVLLAALGEYAEACTKNLKYAKYTFGVDSVNVQDWQYRLNTVSALRKRVVAN